MTDIDALAARMFPSMAPPAPAPAAAPAPATADATASPPPAAQTAPTAAQTAAEPAAPNDDSDPEMKALREDAAERMFSRPESERAVRGDLLARLVGTTVEIDGQAVEFTEDMAQEGLAQLRTMAADLQISRDDLSSVNEGFTLAESIRGDEAKTIAARETAVDRLNAEYGQDATLAARAARTFVAKNPKLAQMLERTGAGDTPQIVSLVARRAMALHRAGRLTVPAAPTPTTKASSPSQGLYSASQMNP